MIHSSKHSVLNSISLVKGPTSVLHNWQLSQSSQVFQTLPLLCGRKCFDAIIHIPSFNTRFDNVNKSESHKELADFF